MTDVLNVQHRDQRGTARMRRLRKSGQIPAILYGHGEANIALAIDSRDVRALMRHGGHIVELKGAVSESALVKEVQWDALGADVLHMDLTRVDAAEAVEVELSIELRGDAPGTHHGGIVKQLMHEVSIRCPANKLPERLELSINSLELEGSLTCGDIQLPPEAHLLHSSDDVVVICAAPAAVVEEAESAVEEATGVAEPEVIGRKPAEEEDS